jgi:glutamate 5-kinase
MIYGANKKYDARKRWIAYSSSTKGSIRVDDGAKKALFYHNKSLLASGILDIDGRFKSGDVVSITDKAGNEFAKGICNYSADELDKIKGLRSSDFRDALGYKAKDEIVHKDNLVIL